MNPDGRMRALVALAQAMARAHRPEEAVRAAAAQAREALDATMTAISVWERDAGQLRVLVNEGRLAPGEEPEPADEVYPVAHFPQIAEYPSHRWAEAPWPRAWVCCVEDVADGAGPTPGCPPAQHARRIEALRRRGRHSCLVAPILLEGRVWGELYAGRTAEQPVFDQTEADFAALLAGQISAGLAQTERLERIRRLALTDPLTGLANRRAVDTRLEEALQRHRADGTAVAIVVCDVNGLKRVNDERGHEFGDQLLERFGSMLSLCGAELPDSLAARLGGDEFCLLSVGSTSDEVVRVAEDLCRRALSLPGGQGVACGIASTDDPIGPVTAPNRLFRLADAAQYRAKALGARHPVVAGRGQRPDATLSLAEAGGAPAGRGRAGDARGAGRRPAERRRFRGALHNADAGHLLQAALAALDDPGGAVAGGGAAPVGAPGARTPGARGRRGTGEPPGVWGRWGTGGTATATAGAGAGDREPGAEHAAGGPRTGIEDGAVEPERPPAPAPAADPDPDREPGVPVDRSLPRLETLADTVARMVDAAAWWIARVPPRPEGDGRLDAMAYLAGYAVYRQPDASAGALGPGRLPPMLASLFPDTRGPAEPVGPASGMPGAPVLKLADAPRISGAARGGSFLLRSVAAERDAEATAMLAGGHRSAATAGGRNCDGGWLVTVLADQLSLSLAELPGVLRALVAVAITDDARYP
ncbi:GGDEF domain-containing protein [Allostreptomyces psammosilenae]|uniref:Diguanylate cyclase (GGDEF)-like protein n=1 Tax=Allostreptomyces psammosilenae TaxID=1892865 RepID=A0A852ZUR2_9ACTN|nr:sensor domain-containing diguanylate cyclase [Allostreptomyces psammosilenae]NYI06126.1 diguanylate cyclase (GGDEF)-like protein [Allostreptomyces psammosilenae]